MASPLLIVANSEFSVDGVQTLATIAYAKQNYKSYLYCACDNPLDECIPGGFATVKSEFPEGHARWVPIDGAGPEFSSTGPVDPMAFMRTFGAVEKALDVMPRPTLITCKSGARASAILCAYLAVRERWTVAETLTFAQTHGQSNASNSTYNWLYLAI